MNTRLRSIGEPEDSVTVTFELLSQPKIDYNILLEMANTGYITKGQFLDKRDLKI